MADNVTYDSNGATPSIVQKTDDISGVHVPYVKILDGTADSSAVIPGDATNGLKVQVTTSASHAVTNAGTFAVQESGSALTALQLIDDVVLAEDAAHASGDKGVMLLTVRKDTAAATSGTDGDYQPAITDANGRLHVIATAATSALKQDDAAFTPATDYVVVMGGECDDTSPDSVNEGDAGALRMSANRNLYVNIRDAAGNERGLNVNASSEAVVGGGVAHDGADSGNPVKVGARAATTLSDDTMVANGDRTDAVSDLDGALIIRNQFPLGDLISERVTNTDGTSTAFSNFGAVASTRSVITAIVAWNSSATAGYIDFRDGTAGSVLYTVPIPAGGGVVLPAGATPYFRTSANTALAYDVSGALSTVYLSVTGYKSKA